ncbi:MAG: hypothetical protein C0390_09610 [Syntrophus sp. (in: bacteria)]|nr:hypothetical protein [Syntrophus sp. (in: bacteria)]
MAMMPPEKLVIFDYSGTLSLEAPRFGRSENLVRALEESGLASLGVATPEIFWGDIVNPTWIEGSTTAIGYARAMAERIAALGIAPDIHRSQIEAAASRFVAAYLASSRIDPRWRPSLSRLSEHPDAVTVIATDHYAEATGKITDSLASWGIPARKCGKGAKSPFSPPSRFFVANSADLGVWKADRRFWEILKSQLPFASVRRILLIDDFGINEESGDGYGGRAKVLDRQEKTIANLEESFQAVVEVATFYLPGVPRESEEAGAGLIAEAAGRIDEFLERR